MSILLVNFGGPRNLDEIRPFLTALLQDRDVIRTRLPKPLHNWLFGRIAAKRAGKVKGDYELIGARSPIFFDTEEIAVSLRQKLSCDVITFHRYLPATHAASLRAIERAPKPLRVLPLFPQFCYATTGSIARFFSERLSDTAQSELRWLHSYATHPAFIASFQKRIQDFLIEKNLSEGETTLLFSAHGVPETFIREGDPYQSECEASFRAISSAFPSALCRLSYQSKFGKVEWIKPYTEEICKDPSWTQSRPHIVLVPLTFTSDHIETLFEIEYLYVSLLRERGLSAYRCPALNLEPYWLDALASIAASTSLTTNRMLIRSS